MVLLTVIAGRTPSSASAASSAATGGSFAVQRPGQPDVRTDDDGGRHVQAVYTKVREVFATQWSSGSKSGRDRRSRLHSIVRSSTGSAAAGMRRAVGPVVATSSAASPGNQDRRRDLFADLDPPQTFALRADAILGNERQIVWRSGRALGNQDRRRDLFADLDPPQTFALRSDAILGNERQIVWRSGRAL
jgi:hypothetical protein